jgi:Tfp pilus assembly protein PilW
MDDRTRRRGSREARRGTGGFTLIEAVLAMALTASLFGVLAQVLSRAAEGYARQADRADLYQMGRVAQDRIARELRAGGTPTIGEGEIVFASDSDGDDVLDATTRFALEAGGIVRQRGTGPAEVLAEHVAALDFEGTELTTIRIRLQRDGTSVELRTAVRHAN